METSEWIVIAAVAAGAVLFLLVLVGMVRRKRRHDHLQERFRARVRPCCLERGAT
jgi:hypothetical protein